MLHRGVFAIKGLCVGLIKEASRKVLLMRNMTHKIQCFSCSGNRANSVSLVGQCGHENKNHYMIYTNLNSVKLGDSEYTNF